MIIDFLRFLLWPANVSDGAPNHAELEAAHAAWAVVLVALITAIGAIWAVVYAGRGYREQARAASGQADALKLQQLAFDREQEWRVEEFRGQRFAAARQISGRIVGTRPTADVGLQLPSGVTNDPLIHLRVQVEIRNDSATRVENVVLEFAELNIGWSAGAREEFRNPNAVVLGGLYPGELRLVELVAEDGVGDLPTDRDERAKSFSLTWRDEYDNEWLRTGDKVTVRSKGAAWRE